MHNQAVSYLESENGRRIAYCRVEGRKPEVLFLGGFASDMTGSKATALDAFCRESGRGFTRFDYAGHGQSSGTFEEGTIGAWTQDALAVLDRVTQGPLVLAGSSMGAWIMLLVALKRPERVRGLLGVASAPDFTEHLLWEKFSDAQKEELRQKGVIHVPSCGDEPPYAITRELIEEARGHLLLHKPLPIACPVRLLHGVQDEDVPWQVARTLMERLESADVQLTLVKDGAHRMSEPGQLALLGDTLKRLLRQAESQ